MKQPTMSDDTTTISITEDQRDELKALKTHERESYKSVIDRLLNESPAPDAGFGDALADAGDPLDDALAATGVCSSPAPDAIADAVATRGVSLDASERKAIAEEVVGMLR